MFKKQFLIAAASAATLTAVTGAAVAMSSAAAATGSATATTVAATSPLTSPVATVDPAAAKAFKAFANSPASPMPTTVGLVGTPGRFGRNPNLARSLKTATGKGWLIPGRGYVCLAVPGVPDASGNPGSAPTASTCQTTGDAATQGLQISIRGSDTATVTTVAPTGSSVVEVAANGKQTPAPTDVDGVSSVTIPASTAVQVVAP